MRNADVADDVADHHAVQAQETENAVQHLVRARAVVAVDEDDLARLGPARPLAGVAHPDHVLYMDASRLQASIDPAAQERFAALYPALMQPTSGCGP